MIINKGQFGSFIEDLKDIESEETGSIKSRSTYTGFGVSQGQGQFMTQPRHLSGKSSLEGTGLRIKSKY